MPKEYPRSQRVGDQMQRELALLIQREVKDPRVKMVSITAVRVSRDMAHARIYVTTLDDENHTGVVEALNHASGFLRHELASSMRLRTIPMLRFYYDESIENGMRMNSLISEALAKGVADDPDDADPDSVEDSAGDND